MKKNIESFPNQILDSLSGFEKIRKEKRNISSVLIIGQGGSSIGALLLKDLLKDDINFPIVINHGYKLPNWVSTSTLIIISSYSGNTEESVNILNISLKKGFKPICISSGGKVLKICEKMKLNFLTLPDGFQPREALAYSIISLFSVFVSHQIVSNTVFDKLKKAAESILELQPKIIKKAKLLTNVIYQKTPIIYSSNLFSGAILRFKQQLNENSKNLSWCNIIPEMNHNEIVGWDNLNSHFNNVFLPVFIKSNLDLKKNQQRIDLTIDYLKQKKIKTKIINLEKGDLYAQYFFLINLFDFISFFLAKKNNVNPYNIDSILMLKEKLK